MSPFSLTKGNKHPFLKHEDSFLRLKDRRKTLACFYSSAKVLVASYSIIFSAAQCWVRPRVPPAQTTEQPSITELTTPTCPYSLLHPSGIFHKFSHLNQNLVNPSEDQVSVVPQSSQVAKVSPQEKYRVYLSLPTCELNHFAISRTSLFIS